MEDYTHAHKVFRPEWDSPYANSDFVREIEVFRKSFNGTLFVDRVLRALGITKCMAMAVTVATTKLDEMYANNSSGF